MRDADAFLQAVIENPDDDGPRLIFADWLEERDDPRGEFIRVQCALARLRPRDRRRAPLKERERALLKQHQEEWVRPLRGLARGWLFRRGFVEAAWLRAPTFVARAGELLALAPVREVRLFECRDIVPAVAASPYLARLAALNLDGADVGDAGARVLAESPHLGRLAALDLGGNSLSDAGVGHLAASPHLGALLSLRLSLNHVRDEGAQALAATRHLGWLETLNLFANGIGDAGALALGRSSRLTRLDTLYLGGNNVSMDGLRALRARLGRRLVV